VLRLDLGHCLVNGLPSWKSSLLSSPYLCLSVSICGCTMVSNAIHNIQGNVPIENVEAMFKAIKDSP
jgi:hypothetical protein